MDRAARAGSGRDRSAVARAGVGRAVRRSLGHRGHGAPDGVAGTHQAGRPGTRRSAAQHSVRRRIARCGPRDPVGAGRRAGPGRDDAGDPRAGRAAAGHPDRCSAFGHGSRWLRVLARRRGDRGSRGTRVARARQRVGLPDRTDGCRPGRLLVPRAGPVARAVGAARRRGCRTERVGSAAGRRRADTRRQDEVRRDVPRVRPARAGLGSARGTAGRAVGGTRSRRSRSATPRRTATGPPSPPTNVALARA